MKLKTRVWGLPGASENVVCIHGIGQHGGIFEALGKRLAEDGRQVVSVDLRGHGGSGHEPPWDSGTPLDDVLETIDAFDVAGATWVGHSFGGRLAAALADRVPERTDRVVMLDPGLSVAPAHALKSAEMDRLDWSFGSVEGAVNALMSSDSVSAAPREVVTAFAESDLKRGADGRLRFGHCPSVAVTAWSELSLPSPPIAQLPTLLVRPVVSAVHSRAEDQRYRDALGSLLTLVAVPNGHNVLWESPAETTAAIVDFLAKTQAQASTPSA